MTPTKTLRTGRAVSMATGNHRNESGRPGSAATDPGRLTWRNHNAETETQTPNRRCIQALHSVARSPEDVAVFETARAILRISSRTFFAWLVVGHAVMRARDIVEQRGGSITRILEREELAVDPATCSHLLRIMDRLLEVIEWWRGLSETAGTAPLWTPRHSRNRRPGYRRSGRTTRPVRPRDKLSGTLSAKPLRKSSSLASNRRPRSIIPTLAVRTPL